MYKNSWTPDEIIGLNRDRETLLKNIMERLAKRKEILFVARLGFGVPEIDFVAVDSFRNIKGYVVKLPVLDGKIDTLPYFQGMGESFFLTDQMLDEAYLLVPGIELFDKTHFTRSPDPIYRLKKVTFESGIALFDRNYDMRVINEAKGSLAKQYQRLKIELIYMILRHGEIIVAGDKESLFNDWKKWAQSELARLGDNRYMDENAARMIIKKILEDKNYRGLKMDIKEEEIPAKPVPIPIYNVKGKGLYLGDEKKFALQISRISGMVIKGDY